MANTIRSEVYRPFISYLTPFQSLLPIQAFCLLKLVSQNNRREELVPSCSDESYQVIIDASDQALDVERKKLMPDKVSNFGSTSNVSSEPKLFKHSHLNETDDNAANEKLISADMQLKKETTIEIP